MTLKIERIVSARETRIRLSGQIRLEHLGQVRSEVEAAERPVVLDLEEVDLVDVDGVRFLNECESSGIPILRCSPYIKEWMQREQGR
jgi:anti-anti-sigma regulatory factor